MAGAWLRRVVGPNPTPPGGGTPERKLFDVLKNPFKNPFDLNLRRMFKRASKWSMTAGKIALGITIAPHLIPLAGGLYRTIDGIITNNVANTLNTLQDEIIVPVHNLAVGAAEDVAGAVGISSSGGGLDIPNPLGDFDLGEEFIEFRNGVGDILHGIGDWADHP